MIGLVASGRASDDRPYQSYRMLEYIHKFIHECIHEYTNIHIFA
jgi:hypothetical protein